MPDTSASSRAAILTDNGREFCGTEQHPFERYLPLNDIKHRRTKVQSPQMDGFMERFTKTILNEFFRIASGKTSMKAWKPFRLPESLACLLPNTGLIEAAEIAENAPWIPR